MRALAFSALALAVSLGVAASAGAAPFSEQDPRGAAQLREEHPLALQLLKQGDAELLAGHFDSALSLLDKAEEEAPATPLIEEKRCAVLGALGRREEALSACDMAIAISGQEASYRRAKVAALVAGAAPPVPADASEAYWIARRITDAAPNEPWGYAAFCDIAERIGDPTLWTENLRQLQHVAPDHYETKRAVQRAEAVPGTWRWKCFGWFVLASASLATAAHALMRQRRFAPPLTARAVDRAHEP
jgi:tetratricopeptide (TPR) repeat protein